MEKSGSLRNEQAQVIARLATLQRLKEDAAKNKRAAMLKNIEQMIEAESALLRKLYDRGMERADANGG